MNLLLLRLTQRGTLSQKQERTLVSFTTHLIGREGLARYRALTGIDTPIPRLSKAEAWKLISEIVSGEGLNNEP